MYLQVINFNLSGINRSEYEAAAAGLTSAFAEFPGLIRKHWFSNDENNTFGGVYIWDSLESMEAYLESDLFAGVKGNPAFTNVSSKTFEVMDELSKTTRGLV